MQKIGKLLQHIDTYVSRYATLAIAILTPAAGLLGTAAADLGNQTSLGKALLAATSALGFAVAGITWLYNRGKWERETGARLADGKTGLFDLIAIAKDTLSEVQHATAQLPTMPAKQATPSVQTPVVPAKPHKPVAPPPVAPVPPPVTPQPPPTHPAPKTNPVSGLLHKLGGLLK
jgi:hypothetical protein